MGKGKVVIGILAVLVVVVTAGILILRGQLDSIVARAIENHGSRLTGTRVTVGEVELELRKGRATISDLQVANPEEFSRSNALELGRLLLDLEPSSLTSEPYMIDEIVVQDVSVLYEADDRGRRNLDVILANLRDAQPSGTEAETEAPLLVVQRLRLDGGTTVADFSSLGVESRTAKVSGITLENLGAPGGAPASEIGKQMLQRLIEQAIKDALDDALEQRLESSLNEKLGTDASEAVKEQIDQLIDRDR